MSETLNIDSQLYKHINFNAYYYQIRLLSATQRKTIDLFSQDNFN